MLQARYIKHTLQFKQASGTSRGVLKTKDSWFLILCDTNNAIIQGIGECSIIEGLSPENLEEYESKLQFVCENINQREELLNGLSKFPSIQFGIETALLDIEAKGGKNLFRNHFVRSKSPIKINGLIWMGNKDFMLDQIKTKIENGFSCLKLKIGAIDFKEELNILENIRSEYSHDVLELRVDANGAFSPQSALDKLNLLSQFDLHSIEQPIKQGQLKEMAKLCEFSPLAIALDEELIGVTGLANKQSILEEIQPHYIILKPSLIGGIKGSNEWIEAAGELSIPWWITSALESNIGLNAISQYTATFNNPLPQGLGTGQLYTNNIDCPLTLDGDQLTYNQEIKWDLSLFEEE